MKRHETARAFATAMGWTIPDGIRIEFVEQYGGVDDVVWWGGLPEAEDLLCDHLAFVGRIAEALNADCIEIEQRDENTSWRVGWRVTKHNEGYASDPSWAAMLAAIAVKATA